MNKIRKIFDIMINDKPRGVFDITGKEHFGYNDTPKTWWLYLSEPLPDNTLPPIDSDSWIPFSCKGMERRLWEIKIKQGQYVKHKWDEANIRSFTKVEMICNGKLIYEFSTNGNDSGLSYAFSKIGYLQTLLSEHCFNFFNPEEEQGRLIYFYGLPAKVRLSSHPGEIHIDADYTAGLNKTEWWKEYFRRKSKIGAPSDRDWETWEPR